METGERYMFFVYLLKMYYYPPGWEFPQAAQEFSGEMMGNGIREKGTAYPDGQGGRVRLEAGSGGPERGIEPV